MKIIHAIANHISFAVIILLLASCHKKGAEFHTGEIQPPVVTGYYERNDVGEIIREVGRPNVKLGDKADHRTSAYYLSVFPTPVSSYRNFRLNIYLKSPDNNVKRVWITAANAESQAIAVGASAAKVGGSPLLSFEVANNIPIILDLKDFPAGFYRIYYQADEHLLYDNILIIKN